MLGLGNYESSSEDEVDKEQSLPESKVQYTMSSFLEFDSQLTTRQQELKTSHVEGSQTPEDKSNCARTTFRVSTLGLINFQSSTSSERCFLSTGYCPRPRSQRPRAWADARYGAGTDK